MQIVDDTHTISGEKGGGGLIPLLNLTVNLTQTERLFLGASRLFKDFPGI